MFPLNDFISYTRLCEFNYFINYCSNKKLKLVEKDWRKQRMFHASCPANWLADKSRFNVLRKKFTKMRERKTHLILIIFPRVFLFFSIKITSDQQFSSCYEIWVISHQNLSSSSESDDPSGNDLVQRKLDIVWKIKLLSKVSLFDHKLWLP